MTTTYYYRRTVTSVEASQFASENGALYVETSAKTAQGVEEAFMRTVASAWEKASKGQLVLRDSEVSHSFISHYLSISLNAISKSSSCICLYHVMSYVSAATIFSKSEACQPCFCAIFIVIILLLI